LLLYLKRKTGGLQNHVANEHTTWHGLLFMILFSSIPFIAGVSIPFSLNKGLQQGRSKQSLYKKAFRRMLILIALGILEKNLPFPFFEWSQIRLGGVLQRIGIAGFITTILYLNFSFKSRAYWVAGILLFYYACMFLVPVPGFGAGDLSFEGNLHGSTDFLPAIDLGTFDKTDCLRHCPHYA
jgi:predicted acyltransferase